MTKGTAQKMSTACVSKRVLKETKNLYFKKILPVETETKFNRFSQGHGPLNEFDFESSKPGYLIFR